MGRLLLSKVRSPLVPVSLVNDTAFSIKSPHQYDLNKLYPIKSAISTLVLCHNSLSSFHRQAEANDTNDEYFIHEIKVLITAYFRGMNVKPNLAECESSFTTPRTVFASVTA